MSEIQPEHLGNFSNVNQVVSNLNLEAELETVTGRPAEEVLKDGSELAPGVLVEELIQEADQNYILDINEHGAPFSIYHLNLSNQDPSQEVIKHPEDPVAKCPGCGYDTATSYTLENEEQQGNPEYATGICGDCFARSLADSALVVYQQ